MKKIIAIVIVGLMLMLVGGVASAHGTKSITNNSLVVGGGTALGKGTFTTGNAGHIEIYVTVVMYRDGNVAASNTTDCRSSAGLCTKVTVKKSITCNPGHTAQAVITGVVFTPNEGSVQWASAVKNC